MTKNIKIFISDVDGVLTDGRMYWTAEGNTMKVFHNKDGIGFKEMKNKGIKTAFVSAGPAKDVLESRAKHLGIDYVYASATNKIEVVEEILKKESLDWSNVAYIGDETPDLECLKKAALSFCPADAHEDIKKVVTIILKTNGGSGCIREAASYL